MGIWTITANPALDLTYRLATLTRGAVHRVSDISVRPGGKGLNVARVLAALGRASTVSGFLGGASGTQLRDLLGDVPGADLITPAFVDVPGATRLSVAVVEADHTTTVLNEAGLTPPDSAWDSLLELLGRRVEPGDVVACCGSLPGDSDPEWMGRLVHAIQDAGARALVDATGPTLTAACRAGADFVKPNDIELRETTGASDVAAGARQLLDAGVGTVITSEGERGMSVHTPHGAWRARPARLISGNPTGAGDASVAAWCDFLADHPSPRGDELAGALPRAVALSGAAVARPVAGEVDLDLFAQMVDEVTVEEY